MQAQLLRFGMVGVAGYIVDALVLYGVMALGMGFLRGRLVSFVCAVVTTFLLNRRYTFAEQLRNAGPRPPLWQEFGRYLAAMAFGGLLNLATYWFVISMTPHFPALYALAVAAGSLVGMVANFASAKWWVFVQRPASSSLALPRLRFELTPLRCIIVVQALFWTSHLTEAELPGLYMDAVNPDYLAAQALNEELGNPTWPYPTLGVPVLGALYHGVQTYYVGIPVFALLGFNLLALRVAQGLFAGGILVMLQLVLQRATGSLPLAFAGALGLASELAFIASFRTQMYIVMAGTFWLLLALYLALARTQAATAPTTARNSGAAIPWQAAKTWLLSGLCAGLAVYSYFVFAFFVPVFVVMGWWPTRNWRVLLTWLLGFTLGMQTYVLGYTLAIAALGGLGPALEWFRSTSEGLGPMSSEQGFAERLAYAWSIARDTLRNMGNEAMIFGPVEFHAWALWKARLLALMPLLLFALGFWKSRRRNAGDGDSSMLAAWHLALLPISFIAMTLIFGNRLWSHHYSALIPLAYLLLLLATSGLRSAVPLRVPVWTGVALVAVLVIGNLQQQHKFFERLSATGGNGYFSNAINRMADDAMSMPADLVHVFPEWGFGMSFAFLTGNRRLYEADASGENLERLAAAGRRLQLYYWQAESGDAYRATLMQHGYQVSNSGTYLQRDQNVAFYWLEAVPASGMD